MPKNTDLAQNVAIVHDPTVGRVLTATRDVQRGDIIFEEAPLLFSHGKLDTKAERDIVKRGHEKHGLVYCKNLIWLRAYCEAPRDVRLRVLDAHAPTDAQIATFIAWSGIL